MASGVSGSLSQSAKAGREAAWRATGGGSVSGGSASASVAAATDSAPQWAKRLRAEQASRAHRHTTAQAIKDGDKPGAAANPDLEDRED
jgi:type IV secretion system protein TrbL